MVKKLTITLDKAVYDFLINSKKPTIILEDIFKSFITPSNKEGVSPQEVVIRKRRN